ncbi:MAG: HAMP domain-containing sensor histidine kinase [Bacteroidales bacterium]|nr:HAMP domain-containing sensor histidine kinase [Bacteroidales bacterium]
MIFIALVTAATIGLMVIQVYWIRDAVKLKQAVFVRDVKQSIDKVVFEINKIQLEERVKEQRRYYEENRNSFRAYDSINRVLYQNFKNLRTINDIDRFMRNSDMASKEISQLTFTYNKHEPGNFYYNNKSRIDSLITWSLKEKQIKTTFEFGIYSPATKSMILQKTGQYPDELLYESFVFDLAPIGSMFAYPNQLLLYFPHEKTFILSQLWVMLIVSVVLFLVIIAAFSFSTYTIFQQKRLSEMKNDFINNMTHEFKTPISTISLACEALQDSDMPKTLSFYDMYVGMIYEENSRLATMAEQILQTAVIDKGQLHLRKEPLNMDDVIKVAMGSKSMAVNSKNGTIDYQPQANGTIMMGDKVHLTNIIINLLDNAIKYCLEAPHIVINTINRGDLLLITVQDNGIGIGKADRKKIFEKLYRVPTGNIHNFKGFGLGLSYVKAIVELHDGQVYVDSEPGKGSTFTIQFPLN